MRVRDVIELDDLCVSAWFARLRAGRCFRRAEAADHAYVPESPTVALKVDKETIKALFLKNPKVFDLVSEILAKRKIALGDISASSAEESKKVKNIAKELKNAIISFLS